jgi:hypothetical protein
MKLLWPVGCPLVPNGYFVNTYFPSKKRINCHPDPILHLCKFITDTGIRRYDGIAIVIKEYFPVIKGKSLSRANAVKSKSLDDLIESV